MGEDAGFKKEEKPVVLNLKVRLRGREGKHWSRKKAHPHSPVGDKRCKSRTREAIGWKGRAKEGFRSGKREDPNGEEESRRGTNKKLTYVLRGGQKG